MSRYFLNKKVNEISGVALLNKTKVLADAINYNAVRLYRAMCAIEDLDRRMTDLEEKHKDEAKDNEG